MSTENRNTPPHDIRSAGLVPRSPQDALQPAEPASPPKRSRQARNKLVVFFNTLISALVLLMIGAFGVAYFGKLRFEEPGPLQITRSIVVQEGSSVARIARQLEATGVIDNDFLFRIGVRAYNAAGDLKAGEYAFNPNVSMYDIMTKMREGKSIVHRISFPEGLTTHQIFERLAENEILEGDLPEQLPEEGSLMPDTYPFQRGTTRKRIVQQMMLAQERFLEEVWAKRIDGLPISTPQEMVTLASIVEKETGRADERPRVAGVFLNRLDQGMRLQSDPTIIYGIFGGEGKPKDRPIYRSDIDKKTDYNTYQIDGLPPGPIANPGRAALEAVANPSRTNELFFVADGTGGHAFAATLDDHNENVRRWREIEKRLKQENGSDAVETGTQILGPDQQASEEPSADPEDEQVSQ